MSTLPLPEQLAVAAFKAAPSITAKIDGRTATRLGAVYPQIRVTLLGGAERPTINTGQPEFQIECWAAGAEPAHELESARLAQAVEAAVEDHELVGSYTAGVIKSAYVFGNVIHSPDPTTHRERHILTIGLLIQP